MKKYMGILITIILLPLLSNANGHTINSSDEESVSIRVDDEEEEFVPQHYICSRLWQSMINTYCIEWMHRHPALCLLFTMGVGFAGLVGGMQTISYIIPYYFTHSIDEVGMINGFQRVNDVLL